MEVSTSFERRQTRVVECRMEYKINDAERDRLYGLPYLQQLLYLRGLRPYMDFDSGMVGVKRGISYQSLCEELYIETHPGYQSGSPSRAQVRRAVKGLEKMGVIHVQSEGKKLLIKCLLATRDYCVQNKGVTKPSQQAVRLNDEKKDLESIDYSIQPSKGVSDKTAKGVTPPVNNIYIYFLWENFEIFWDLYPVKKSKQKAWEIFQTISPSAEEFQTMLHGLEKQCIFYQEQQRNGCWVPAWKYPTNWLLQRCWDDELVQTSKREGGYGNKQTYDAFWESCKEGGYDEACDISNVIQLSDYQIVTKSD